MKVQCREGAHVRPEGGGGHAGRNRRNVIGIVNSLVLLVVLVLLIKVLVVMGVNVLLRGVLSAGKRKVIGVIRKAQVGVHVRLVDAETSPYTGEKLRIGEEALALALALVTTLGVIGVMGLVGHFQCGQHGHRRH